MKLSFSTRGWAHLSWEEWIEAGVNMRFEGIDSAFQLLIGILIQYSHL